MIILAILIVLLLGNWLTSSALVFIPLYLFNRLNYLGRWSVVVLLLIFLAWCLGDE